MRYEKVDLYAHFSVERPKVALGELTCWYTETSPKVSVSRRRPAVLILPGGAYTWTSPREAEPVALRFAARGWAAFVLDYSCAPLSFPVSLREAALAMRYIRENAQAMEIDPHMVAAMGFSAGGHLCGTLGTMWDAPEVADLAPAGMVRPDALGLCYPVAVSWGRTHEKSFENITAGDKGLWERLSLDALVRPDMPPCISLAHPKRRCGSLPKFSGTGLRHGKSGGGFCHACLPQRLPRSVHRGRNGLPGGRRAGNQLGCIRLAGRHAAFLPGLRSRDPGRQGKLKAIKGLSH